MKRRVITGMMLILLLISMLTLTFSIKPVQAGLGAPSITILSPKNATYPIWIPDPPMPITIPPIFIPLTFTVNETTSSIGYSLDGQANVTITGNTTLPHLSLRTHSIVVYANDTVGNMGSSETVHFTLKLVGDQNGDGKITIIDIVIVALHFGEDDPDPSVDLNLDGRVTITDIVIVALFFGVTWV